MIVIKKLFFIVALALLSVLVACAAGTGVVDSGPAALPASEPDGESMFGVDKNINIETIDSFLDRDDVAYIDVRMLFDPAAFGEIGGEADLTRTIRGFKIVPYPYIATLAMLPVPGAYDGPRLFEIAWGEDGQIASVTANYVESDIIMSELFPKDKAIFLMCGGGGYSGMMKSLLIYLGWDGDLIYNTGANWSYTGENALELIIYPEDARDEKIFATWRADYAYIEFSKLQRIAE